MGTVVLIQYTTTKKTVQKLSNCTEQKTAERLGKVSNVHSFPIVSMHDTYAKYVYIYTPLYTYMYLNKHHYTHIFA